MIRNFIKILLLLILFCLTFPNPANGSTLGFSEGIPRSGNKTISNGSRVIDANEDCCGTYGYSCSYYNGEVVCDCWPGYAQYGILCEECKCEDPQMVCKFVSGFKQCTCPFGYIEISGKCYQCNCGPNSVSCRLNLLKEKVCTCKSGYVAKKGFFLGDDICQECNCGPYSTSCTFTNLGFRECRCKSGSVLVKGFRGIGDQKCVECDCGVHSISCKVNSYDVKECNCYFGYDMKFGDTECKYYGVKDSTVSGWKIATIITSVLFVFIIIMLLVKICSK